MLWLPKESDGMLTTPDSSHTPGAIRWQAMLARGPPPRSPRPPGRRRQGHPERPSRARSCASIPQCDKPIPAGAGRNDPAPRDLARSVNPSRLPRRFGGERAPAARIASVRRTLQRKTNAVRRCPGRPARRARVVARAFADRMSRARRKAIGAEMAAGAGRANGAFDAAPSWMPPRVAYFAWGRP